MATTRRTLIKSLGLTAATLAVAQGAQDDAASMLRVDPSPLFDLSPHLYMQFMEPLGATDGSVEASWDYARDRWRPDLIETTRQLGPTMMRWGGCFSSYYRWKEAVGPRSGRVPMQNLLWGGMESNQIGTMEFLDFCSQVKAEPLMCVNFESDGRRNWMATSKGDVRTAGPQEAAEWVDYCNNPSNALRIEHGVRQERPIKLWQLGNETSYDPNGFDRDTAGRKTVEFARIMRKTDPTLKFIGWGDSGWAKRMIEIAGEHLQYIAFHHMFNPGGAASPLQGTQYRKDPDRTWQALMDAWKPHDGKIRTMRQQVEGSGIPLALTECHFALPGPNRCAVLSTWGAGVSMARILNLHSRNGDLLKIATAADFCGTRWTVNAVILPTPAGGAKAYMQPVARVMSLFRAHVGEKAVKAAGVPDGLDVTASRTGDKVFLHVVNTQRTRSIDARLAVANMKVTGGKVFEIAADPEFEVWAAVSETLAPKQKTLPESAQWTFPAASVSAVELDVAPA